MIRFDGRTASCRVLTFKAGALSALGHDLELAVERFTIEVDDAFAIDASFDPSSLRVLGASIDGRVEPLPASDRDKIERTIVEEVLDARRHPTIRYRAAARRRDDGGFDLDGELVLHGASRPLRTRAERSGDRLVAEVRLSQPDFGIRPYRAMLGALRIQPEVLVRVTTPASER